MLLISTDRQHSRTVLMPVATDRYTLTAANLTGRTVMLNGHRLQFGAGDALPTMAGVPTAKGSVTLAPATITFLVAPSANDPACR